ncbi:retrovirus-related Pol polyprotein from transposon 17.6 [Trichonephila clavata]|uniref:Retrovirus-related Pol polyprotein from transposon 17.6 n=1 Tax=Trichonephila clavata TaxID=2740835 RepID=A0A8X6GHU4_TRICU|nr:retrovirus-related Pol polyprotein from transposon 17.6 [Trichonephila clavata]
MFRGARKEELTLIADELGEIINPEMKVLDLKNLILNSDKYKTDKVFIDDYLDSIIADRKSKEEQERLTEQSKLEFEKIKLEQIKLEIELGKINLERAKVDSQRDSNDLQRINPETNQTSIENFIQNNSNDEFGKITLSSAFGENVEAKLIKTSITLDNNSLNHPMDCLVAITDKLNAEALIPPSLYEALCSINNETNENDIFAESVDSFTPFSNDENDAESGNEIFYVESDSDNLNFNSDYSKMKDEQNNCDSLKKIRKYHPRALAVGVIFEDDHEFGEIHPTPNLLRSTSERVLHETDLNHLKETEREQVLAILLKHRTLFTSDVKIAKVLKFGWLVSCPLKSHMGPSVKITA